MVCAIGWNEDENSYIYDVWNFIDFIALILLTTSAFSNDLIFFGILRFLRLIKILSEVKYFKNLKNFLKFIRDTIYPVIGIGFLLCCFIIIFGIIGLNFMMGIFHYRC